MTHPLSPRRRVVLVAALLPALSLALVAIFPAYLYVRLAVGPYLVAHTIFELASIVVSTAIFAVNWHAYRQRANARALLIGVAFLTVAILDTMHTLSYNGMPDFISPNSVGKAIVYWLAARLTEACAVLAAVFVSPGSRHPLLSRNALLAASLSVAAAVFIAVTYFWDFLPVMYVEGLGLTPLKVALEYAVIAINFAAIVFYWRRSIARPAGSAFALVPALVVVIFAEFSFTLYASAYDSYNLLGHIFKVVAYYLIFRALFRNSVEHPYIELRQRHEQLAALSKTAIEVASSLEVDTIAESVLGHCQRLTRASVGFLGLLDTAGRLDVVAQGGPIAGRDSLPEVGAELLSTALRQGHPVRLPAWPARQGADMQPDLGPVLGVPLLVKGRPIGLVALANRPGGFDEAEEELVAAFASQTAVAIENARLYAAERRLLELERNKAKELYQINRALNSSLGLTETLRAVVTSARDLLGAEAAAVLLVDHDGRRLRLAAGAGTPTAVGLSFSARGTLAAEIIGSDRPAATRDVQSAAEVSALGLDSTRLRSMLAAPLHVRGKLSGVLEVYGGDGANGGEDVDLVMAFGDAAAVAIANAEMYEQLRAEDERLRELDRMKDEFIALASHELKNPITAIVGYGQLMLKRMKPGESEGQAKAWQAVARQAERLHQLVNQLLDVSRMQMGLLELNPKRVDLVDLARGIVEQWQATSQNHRLELAADRHAVVGYWDASLLEQLLTNLVGNAIKYSPSGGKVTVLLTACDAAAVEHLIPLEQRGESTIPVGSWAVVSVADQGVGIPKSSLHHIFRRFFRADNTRALRVSGLGLGLYISQEIVSRHGGRMWVVSEENAGAQFSFALPIAQPVGAESSADAGEESGTPPSPLPATP